MSIILQYINDISTTFALNKLTETPDAMSNLWMLYMDKISFNNENIDRIMRVNNISGVPSVVSPYYKFNYISSNLVVPLKQTGYTSQELHISVVIDQDYKLAQELYSLAYNTKSSFDATLYFLKPQLSGSVTNTIDTETDEEEIKEKKDDKDTEDTTKASTQIQKDHSEELKTKVEDDSTKATDEKKDTSTNENENSEVSNEKKTLFEDLKLLTKQFENSQIAQGIFATIKDGINSGWLLKKKVKHMSRDMNIVRDAFTESILENDKILELVDPRTFFGLQIAKRFEFENCYITSFEITNSLNYQSSSPITGTFVLHFENIKDTL